MPRSAPYKYPGNRRYSCLRIPALDHAEAHHSDTGALVACFRSKLSVMLPVGGFDFLTAPILTSGAWEPRAGDHKSRRTKNGRTPEWDATESGKKQCKTASITTDWEIRSSMVGYAAIQGRRVRGTRISPQRNATGEPTLPLIIADCRAARNPHCPVSANFCRAQWSSRSGERDARRSVLCQLMRPNGTVIRQLFFSGGSDPMQLRAIAFAAMLVAP